MFVTYTADAINPWTLCPPPGSTGSGSSGTGHRQQPAVSEPPKKPVRPVQ